MREKGSGQLRKWALYLILAVLAASIVATVLGWRYYVRTAGDGAEHTDDRVYGRHYVIITDDSASLLWQDIYRSAREEAAGRNAYLELLGEWEERGYSLTDYMNIAVASQVDGIIVKPDGTAKLRQAINEAEEAGIPVITVLEDDSKSGRTSFVGVNSYEMGTAYGSQILNCLEPDTEKVTVLLNRGDAGKDLVFKQLKATVQEGLPQGRELSVDSMAITPGNNFDAEETIRDLVRDEKTRPDLLVCMDETDSECACYAVVDYNLVGAMQIIGYYQSEGMLSAVQKGIIPTVITLDTAQVGRYSIEALEEFYSMGYVSSYFSVDLNIITQQNVEEYLDRGGN